MKHKYSYLTKNVLLFALNGFIPNLLAFILIPVYTNYLTTAEYGISDLMSTTVQLLIPIFTLDIQDAVLRFAMDKEDPKEVLSVATRIIIVGTIIISIIALAISLLKIKSVKNEYLFFVVIMYFTTAVNNSILLFLRAIDKVKIAVISGIINSVITLGANILFLVDFKWGLVGYLTANSLGTFVAIIISFVAGKLYKYISFNINDNLFKEMKKYSFPLIFSVIAWWVNSASDRYILSWFSGVAISGIYAVAYKIPSILTVFQNIFSQAWSVSAIKEYDKDDTDGFISNMYNLMNFGMIAVCSLIMMASIPIAKFLFAIDFFEAWKYVPPLLISVVFNAMALFIGSIFSAVKDTKTLSISTIIGAAVNTGLNFILIYYFDAYGAAIATMLGYATTLIMRHVILRRYIILKINMKRDLISYGLLIIQMITAFWGWKAVPAQCIVFAIIMAFYKNEIKSGLSVAQNYIGKLKEAHKE